VMYKVNPRFYLALPMLIASMLVPLYGQGRVNDKDLERFIRNLHEDAKAFRPAFEAALKKSTIRKTSQEKDAKNTAERFEKQTASFADNFKRTHKGDTDLPLVVSTAQQLDNVVTGTHLNPQAVASWRKVRADLNQVTNAFGASSAFAPPVAEGRPGISPYAVDPSNPGPACSQSVGEDHANRLVSQCLAVSPATHPPCNASNSCVLIIDEIKRSCAMLGSGAAPAFCNEYR
jgi:hypothetical protein